MSIDGKLFRSRTNHAGKLSSSCRCSKSGSTLLAEMKLFKHTRPIKTVAAMLVYRPMVTDTDSHKNCWQVQQSIPSSPLTARRRIPANTCGLQGFQLWNAWNERWRWFTLTCRGNEGKLGQGVQHRDQMVCLQTSVLSSGLVGAGLDTHVRLRPDQYLYSATDYTVDKTLLPSGFPWRPGSHKTEPRLTPAARRKHEYAV